LYEVHRLDLETGAVINDYYTPEVGLDTWMRGHARGQVMSPDASFLYTLYSIDPEEERIKDPADPDGFGHFAFVHVISLEEEWSFCIFLPSPFGQRSIDSMGLAVSPDGSTLVAIDSRPGALVQIDTAELTVTRNSLIGEYDSNGPVPLAIAPDGMIYAAFGSFVQAFEPVGRSYVAGLETAGTVRSMDLSEDGRFLRVAVPERIHVIDLVSGEEIGQVVLPESAKQVIVGPPTGTRRFEEFTCAC
ncbi:MAG: YncE family protein, partial [Acidimicrobiia bacterium]